MMTEFNAPDIATQSHRAWLPETEDIPHLLSAFLGEISVVSLPAGHDPLLQTLRKEISHAFIITSADDQHGSDARLRFLLQQEANADCEGFTLAATRETITVQASTARGLLYGWFHLLKRLMTDTLKAGDRIKETPAMPIRMINHWDNMDGSIERGYAGHSLFFHNNQFIENNDARLNAWARLLASVGINAIAINNVNVHHYETQLLTPTFRQPLKRLAMLFSQWGISLHISINYASPIELGGLSSADPLDPQVRHWWRDCFASLWQDIPQLGGVVVKADSEHRPGPFTYGRTHADGANMLAEALAPFDGVVFWRCFVYNCLQDWRDRKTDRARAAYDNFVTLDGQFHPNVILQIKNGPMDFQVREPVSPLLGAMPATSQVLELQITQEYTGQQIDLFWLVPQWQTILAFNTHLTSGDATVAGLMSGKGRKVTHSGITAVVNVGDDANWTGHPLAQANLYGYGNLLWCPTRPASELAREWCMLTLGKTPQVVDTVSEMLLTSGDTYEKYTAPLGVGWMVNPHHHYGPNVDGYEYDLWGTYHYADRHGLGVDRTLATGTGFTGQYAEANCRLYDSVDSCPDELVLFFHHLPYQHRLKSGKSIIQHIYDTHFAGVEEVESFCHRWHELADFLDPVIFSCVSERLSRQYKNACEWRDRVNTYFYRKSGINDIQGRVIYK
ncbi:glycoside hydrolase family 20 zincin-like fold domain-containing protein [Erwinia papayae]|uniref:Glycoside hydrolase family 20 zincin-like fold domain-containing protein n=1 Tax=Erwinia papayae TaxID=206499 RepID=A0ABV3N652_9GAMM